MDCSLPSSSVHGILQERILEQLPCPPPGDLSNPRIRPRSPTLQADSLPAELPGKPIERLINTVISGFPIKKTRSSMDHLQFSLVAQSCLTLCDPMNRSMPGLPAHHQLPEFTQTHVHRVSDAIQPSHPLSSPSPPARNPSQH